MAMELVADRQASPMMTVARDVNAANVRGAGGVIKRIDTAVTDTRLSPWGICGILPPPQRAVTEPAALLHYCR